MKQDLSLETIIRGLSGTLAKVRPYTGLMFFVMLALLYGFTILQINNLSVAPVDDNQVTTEVSTSPSLHVDPNAAKQLESLKSNSDNVKTLFQDSRTNPFNE
jgi:hypothetical protein